MATSKLEKLQFIIGVLDKASGPIGRIQNKLHHLGIEQGKLANQSFHRYGDSATEAAGDVAKITAALTAATAATGALVTAMLPLAAMGATGLAAAVGTANAMGVSRESTQITQKTGVSEQQIQLYRMAGRSVGIEGGFGEVGDIGGVFEELSDKLGELGDKGKEAEIYETLQKIKLPIKQVKNLKPDKLIEKVSLQMDKLDMSSQQKVEILDDLAGDASKLLPLFDQGSAKLKRFQMQAKATGAFITPEQTRLMEITNTEIALMKTGMEGYGNTFSEVGGNFMRLFGPEINDWFVDNSDAMSQWSQNTVKELERLHKVFKNGGLSAVYEDLFPNLSVFTRRTGAFISGFSREFLTPFMSHVRETWSKVSAILGNTAGGAEGMGAALGSSILPFFVGMMSAMGDAVIFLEQNWAFIEQMFAGSPLGLLIENWDGITDFLSPIADHIRDLADSLGLIAPGINESGSSIGTLIGAMAALAGILFLNKVAFGALYKIVRLYKGLLIIVKAITMLVTASTWLWRASLVALRAGIVLIRALGFISFITVLAAKLAFAAIKTGLWTVALWTNAAAMRVIRAIGLVTILAGIIGRLALVTLKTWLWNTALKAVRLAMLALSAIGLIATLGKMAIGFAATALATGGMSLAAGVLTGVMTALSVAMAVITSPITLIIAGVAALAAGAYYLYQNWDKVTQYLSNIDWAGALNATLNAILHPVDTFNNAIGWMGEKWQAVKSYLGETSWGQAILFAINALFSPFSVFSGLSDTLKNTWESVKASLSETSWGQAILGVIDSILAAIAKFKEGWAFVKNAASEKIGGAWNSIKSAVGLGDSSNNNAAKNGGARALGGQVLPNHFYRVNEYGPELLNIGSSSYLMTGGVNGSISPFPSSQASNHSLQNFSAANDSVSNLGNHSSTSILSSVLGGQLTQSKASNHSLQNFSAANDSVSNIGNHSATSMLSNILGGQLTQSNNHSLQSFSAANDSVSNIGNHSSSLNNKSSASNQVINNAADSAKRLEVNNVNAVSKIGSYASDTITQVANISERMAGYTQLEKGTSHGDLKGTNVLRERKDVNYMDSMRTQSHRSHTDSNNAGSMINRVLSTSQRNQSNSRTVNGRSIHIGHVTIQVSGQLDVEQLMHELENAA